MTWLQIYALVGVPAILLLMAFGAVKLADHDRRVMDRKARERPAAE